jgi:signal transduction histidine kinase
MATTNRAAVRAPATERRRGGGFRLPAFRDWSVRTKLVAVLLIPAVAAVAIGVFRVTDLLDRADDLAADAEVSQAQEATADLVAEIGREQVVAVADVGDVLDQTPALASRDEQQQATDTAAAVALERVRATGLTGDVERRTRGLENALDRLTEVRQATAGDTDSGLQPVQVARAYHEVSAGALALGEALVGAVGDERLQSIALTGQSLTATNREVALADALVLAVAAAGPGALDPAELRSAVTDREDAFRGFQGRATAEQQSRYSGAFMNDEGQARSGLFAEVLRTLTADGDPEVAPEAWTSVAVPSAAAGEGVREELSAEQVALALDQRDETRIQALQEAVIVLLLLGLGLAVTLLAARSILRPLARLRGDAIAIAEDRLPRAIERIRESGPDSDIQVQPVDIRSREEIGQVARAFDAVHVEAVRLAADQEQLRRNVNELFVNLSRRSQALVERQLALIDRLENDEADPDQLAQLFRLDHLAARMRRNNDNLMVLAGSEASRGAGRALRVVDVVRAAVSETEQYERVTVRAAPGVTVASATSHDLVHLLAELLDNATVFSAPDTTVTVDVEGSTTEGLRIEVADRGLGIPPGDLDELNSKLSEPPLVDSGVPRQMGLFVVAHLARRHGIRVWLRPGTGGRGTVAVVQVPPAVLVGGDAGIEAPAPRSALNGAGSAPSVLPPPAVPAPADPVDSGVAARSGTGVTAGSDDGRNATDTRPQVPVGVDPVPSRTPASAPVAREPVPPAPAAGPTRDAMPSTAIAAGGLPAAGRTTGGGADGLRTGGPEFPGTPRGAPWEAPPEEDTPIFRELSAWFRASTPGTGAVRAPEPVNGITRPASAPVAASTPAPDAARPAASGDATVHRIPTTPVSPEPAVASAAFASAADEGWQAAAAAGAAQPAEVTAAGLPRRRPMAQLVPGSAPSAAPSRRPRDADAVRGRLANYQRGLQSGRTRIRSTPESTAPDAEFDQHDQRRYAP